ncbi:ABC transporter substrate-binding protein [Bradyrhizobium diversitatis]|uniref:ABC transporter substrate-binding protein n=1 Tax=Bradyrhizobium diversitatis TaxID=2755406 RepID=A0ABS0NVI6_9BRAD|nr:ABC transporter substrate-binding protein [Bradyrhizobium diversitatis]MBH5385027.1 ABC transporter substrate-binding protein [Bradyrhizobium diversitatis]
MPTRRSTILGLLGMAAAHPVSRAFAQSGAAPIKIRVASVISSAWLPLWVAKDKGIFLEKGLDVDIMTVQNLSTTIGALGRQLDISGATAIDIVKAAAGGLDVVGVCGNTIETAANRQMRLIAGNQSGISSIGQLNGKTIGTPSINGVIHIATLLALKRGGVDPKSVRFIEMMFPNMADQLQAQRVDAVEAVEPFVAALNKSGHVDLGDPMLQVGDPITLTCWMANGTWARANADAIARWVAALEEARAYIAGYEVEAREILAKWTRLPNDVIESIVLPTYSTSLTAKHISAWIEATRETGQLTAQLNASNLVLK